MSDLSVSYMGLELKNPVIAGASGLTSSVEMIKRIEDAGAGAIVCKSLFEEEIQYEAMEQQKAIHKYDDIHAEMITVFPDIKEMGPEYNLFRLRKTKEAVSIPVIASLNAVNEEVWIEYAKLIEQTGVDGLELNIYSSPEPDQRSPSEVEVGQLNLLRSIREAVSLPLSVKLSPYYTNPGNFIKQIDDTGINGVVLFNRFFQSNIDINSEKITFPYTFSHKEDSRLPMRYAGLLSGNMKGSVCASSGIMEADDVVRMLLAGADAVQVVSTLYKNGVGQIAELVGGLEDWMGSKNYSCIGDFRGKMSRASLGQREQWLYKRTQYVKMLMQSSEDLAEKILQ